MCQLPPAAADFAARDLDRRLLVDGLADVHGPRVTVVWGPEGVGKTELAVRVAHELRPSFPDGQWYVALNGDGPSAGTEPKPVADVLADLLIAIGVPANALPRSAEARAAVLRARISDRRVLLVLDGARNVQEVRALLPGTPSAAVLITSRSALGELPGARRHSVAALTVDESLAMLNAMLGENRVRAEITAARELADACAGVPQALRAASARLLADPRLSLGDLVRELPPAPGRQRELHYAVAG
ncbi:ATP-binding protein [Actinomadura rudentiformis]|uniref:ATP-binding protein n=2 Tax=Actinomadura rudentiformis TaxID=359158 RepID=A0A6H9Z0S9_9ACTN|nr:ATP-binding protein [Actinomadura rudentiformis]